MIKWDNLPEGEINIPERKEGESILSFLERMKDLNPQFRGFSSGEIGIHSGLFTQGDLMKESKRIRESSSPSDYSPNWER